MKASKTILTLVLLILISCGSKSFDKPELLWDFLNDQSNGYMQTKTIEGIKYTLLYKPTDALVNQELSETKNDSIVTIIRDRYKQNLYFNLSMSRNDKELLSTVNRTDFGKMVNELAFNMNKNVHLFSKSKDTLMNIDFIYPRMYGMSSNTSMLFVYKREEEKLNDPYLNLTITDFGLNTGEVSFKIPTKLIKNEPTIKFIK